MIKPDAYGHQAVGDSLAQVGQQIARLSHAQDQPDQPKDEVHAATQHSHGSEKKVEIEIDLADNRAALFVTGGTRDCGGQLDPPPGQDPHRQPDDDQRCEPGYLLGNTVHKAHASRGADEQGEIAGQADERGTQADGRHQVVVQLSHPGGGRWLASHGCVAAQDVGMVGPHQADGKQDGEGFADVAVAGPEYAQEAAQSVGQDDGQGGDGG